MVCFLLLDYICRKIHENRVHVSFNWMSTSLNISYFLILKWARANDQYVLELDFEPFNATFPRPTRTSSIGNGVQFLNRHLSSIMFRNRDCFEPLLDFLRAHKHKGHVSFVTKVVLLRISSGHNLISEL